MLSTPEIITTEPIKAAAIKLKVLSSEIMQHMGPGISEIFALLASHNVAPSGPWFSHHFKAPGEFFDFEICVPVEKDVTLAGRVVMTIIPSAKVARTTYTGPYEGLGAAWGEHLKWVKDQGHAVRDDLWEVYAKGPESGPDSSAYQTILHKPLKA
jgi:effector-binding domain-containing protein